jgi:hypothetical protein
MPLVPNGSLLRCQSVQVYHHHLPPVGAGISSESGQCCYIYGSYSVCTLFFRFRRGRPLHNVLALVFRILTEDPAILLANSIPRVSLKFSLTFPLLPKRNRSFRTLFLMPLLHSGYAKVSSRTSVLSRSFLQHCPCLVHNDRGP